MENNRTDVPAGMTSFANRALALPNSLLKKCYDRTAALLQWSLYIMAMLYNFAIDVVRPSTWRKPVRDRLARQILFTGVEAVPFTVMVALLAGGAVFIQCMVWMKYTGQMDFLIQMISALLVREAAPFLASYIVIAASASAMTTELANMKISGQVALMESQGVNLFRYLAIPRILGLGVSVAVLSIIFSAVALFASGIGYVLVTHQLNSAFYFGVIESIHFTDLVALLGKSFLPGIATGAICCFEGLRVSGATTIVPRAVSQAMLRSISAGALIWGIIFIFTFRL